MSCRLNLDPAFLHRQQALLQARLLHMLLPLQQALSSTAAAASGMSQQPQQQQQLEEDDDYDEGLSVQSEQKLAGIELRVLNAACSRVQGFVSALHQARLEQQRQALPQLQQQLARLAAACKKEQEQQQQLFEDSSSRRTTSSCCCCSQISGNVMDAQHVLQTPSAAELLGFGNLQQLLSLEQQQRIQQQDAGTAAQMEHCCIQQLLRLPPKHMLTMPQIQMYLDCMLDSSPEELLTAWVAQSHECAHNASLDVHEWERRRLQQLLQQQAGLSEVESHALAAACVGLSGDMGALEVAGAAAAGNSKVLHPHPALATGSSSSNGNLSGGALVQVIVAIDRSDIPLRERLKRIVDNEKSAPFSWLGFLPALVRAAVANLPGQQELDEASCNNSSSSSRQELREQLLARLEVLQQLPEAFWITEQQQLQAAASYKAKGQMYQQRLQQLLRVTLQLPAATAASLAAGLVKLSMQQCTLLNLTPVCCGFHPPEGGWAAAGSSGERVRVRLATAAVCADIFGSNAVAFLSQELGVQELSAQLTSSFNPTTSSSKYSCITAAAAAAAAASKQRGASDVANFTWLLDALETYLLNQCGLMLQQALLLQDSTALSNAAVAADECGAAAQNSLQILSSSKQSLHPTPQQREFFWQLQSNTRQLIGFLNSCSSQASSLVSVAGMVLPKLHAVGSVVQLLRFKLRGVSETAGNSSGQSSSSNAAGECSAAAAASGSKAASSAAAQQQQQQLLLRLSQLEASLEAADALVDLRGLLVKVEVAARQAAIKAGTAAGAFEAAGSGSSSSSSSSGRQAVMQWLESVVAVCRTVEGVHGKLSKPDGPVAAVIQSATAAGLGLLASLGVWDVTQPLPPAAAGMSEDGVTRVGRSSNSADSGVAESASNLNSKITDSTRQRHVSNSSSSSGGAASADSGSSGGRKDVMLLQQWAVALQQQGLEGLEVLRDLLITLGDIVPPGGPTSSSGSSKRLQASSGGKQCYGLARCLLAQAQRRLGTKGVCEGSAAASNRSNSSSSSSAGTDIAALVQAAIAGSSSSSSSSDSSAAAGIDKAIWGLLAACKPSITQAMCCHMIPAACRSYEAFERAVLGWPPQSESAAAAAAADIRAANAAQRARKSADRTSSSKCICGEEGESYTRVEQQHEVPGLPGQNTQWMLKMDHPVVCAKPSCVVRELRWLAQQGRPYGAQREMMAMALQALRTDCLVLPSHYR
jgi:hypothetical protein